MKDHSPESLSGSFISLPEFKNSRGEDEDKNKEGLDALGGSSEGQVSTGLKPDVGCLGMGMSSSSKTTPTGGFEEASFFKGTGGSSIGKQTSAAVLLSDDVTSGTWSFDGGRCFLGVGVGGTNIMAVCNLSESSRFEWEFSGNGIAQPGENQSKQGIIMCMTMYHTHMHTFN